MPPTTATAPATAGYFWGLRLHTLMTPDETPRDGAMALTSPRSLPATAWAVKRSGSLTVLDDKGYAGRDLEADDDALRRDRGSATPQG
jgi:hypothetical protein